MATTIDYWQNRALQLEHSAQWQADDVIRISTNAYNTALDNIENNIKKIFDNFSSVTGLSSEDGKALISESLQNDIITNLLSLKQSTSDKSQLQEIDRKINALAYGGRINRYEAVKQTIYTAMKEAGVKERTAGLKTLRNVYKDSYTSTMKGIGASFSVPPKRAINAAINSKWYGKNYSQRVWSNTSDVARYASGIVRSGLADGSSIDDMVKSMREYITEDGGGSVYNATRLMRTETAHFLSKGELEAYKDADVEYYEFLGTDDGRMCEGECGEINGQRFKVSEAVEGVNYPPMHPNCRCTTIPVIEGFEQEKTIDNSDESDIIESEVLEKPLTSSVDDEFDDLLSMLNSHNIDYLPVEKHSTQLGETEIISQLSGDDQTRGSCASVGLCYIGQKQGWNVLDFRGGISREFFSKSDNLLKLSQTNSVKTLKATGASSITVGKRLLKQCEKGKEYYLCVGTHASIVRLNDDGKLQYLELQSVKDSGWQNFDRNLKRTLKYRFGCRSVNDGGNSKYHSFMINITDSDFETDEFKSLLGYINTSVSKQRKGLNETIKQIL